MRLLLANWLMRSIFWRQFPASQPSHNELHSWPDVWNSSPIVNQLCSHSLQLLHLIFHWTILCIFYIYPRLIVTNQIIAVFLESNFLLVISWRKLPRRITWKRQSTQEISWLSYKIKTFINIIIDLKNVNLKLKDKFSFEDKIGSLSLD